MNTTTTTQQTPAQKQAAGLRLLADMIEQNPQLAENFQHTLTYAGINLHLYSDDRAAEMAEIARIARRYGATTRKDISDTLYLLNLDFGGLIKADIVARRDEVCELVVTGTREVTEEVPDPDALAAVPTTTVTRTEPVTEWVCKPLLATESAVADRG